MPDKIQFASNGSDTVPETIREYILYPYAQVITPFIAAVLKNNYAILKLLINNGKEKDDFYFYQKVTNAFHLACKYDFTECALALMSFADLNEFYETFGEGVPIKKNKNGVRTPAMNICINCNITLLEALIGAYKNRFVSWNAKDIHNLDALSYAIMYNFEKGIPLLLDVVKTT